MSLLYTARPASLAEYREKDVPGWIVEADIGTMWAQPAWDEKGYPELTETFASKEAAQTAIDEIKAFMGIEGA